jgi:hypothetical protein
MDCLDGVEDFACGKQIINGMNPACFLLQSLRHMGTEAPHYHLSIGAINMDQNV